ncbi:MAG: hypothetical protein WBE92_15115 [Steroidobacteraceae bacterium]
MAAHLEENLMALDSWITNPPYRASMPAPGELMADYRARIAHEQSLASERRQAELAEQVSARNTPGERIRIWERRHGLTLPRDSNHRLLGMVAAETDLAVEQVQEEQRRRLGAARGTPDPVAAPAEQKASL